jgi:hypothetical protein
VVNFSKLAYSNMENRRAAQMAPAINTFLCRLIINIMPTIGRAKILKFYKTGRVKGLIGNRM